MLSFRKGELIFAHGDPSDAVFIIRDGWVAISLRVRSRESTVDIRGAKDFIGIDPVAGQPTRATSARALTDCRLLRIETKTMTAALAENRTLSLAFMADVMAWMVQYQQDLAAQRTQPAEKRLARILLRLSRFDGQSSDEAVFAKVSQETLADIVGTTRSRVSFFMNKFRDAGFVDYAIGNPNLVVRRSLVDFCAQ